MADTKPKQTAIMTPDITLRRLPDRWNLPIESARITQFLIDHALAIRFQIDMQRTILRIENDFYLYTGDVPQPVDLSKKTEVGSVLMLYNMAVTDFSIRDNGRLEVAIGDEYRLLIDPHPEQTAWQILADSGLRVACMPHGQLSITRVQS